MSCKIDGSRYMFSCHSSSLSYWQHKEGSDPWPYARRGVQASLPGSWIRPGKKQPSLCRHPSCSPAPHTPSYVKSYTFLQGRDEEGVSFWSINRLEYGLLWKTHSWKFCVTTLQCVPWYIPSESSNISSGSPRTSAGRERFFLPCGNLRYILLWYWCKSAYGRWGLVGTIHIFHAQIFHHFNFFCNQS